MKQIMKSLIFTLMGFFILTPLFAIQDEVPDFEFHPCSIENVGRLIEILNSERISFHEDLKQKYPGKPEKVAQNPNLIAFDKVLADSKSLFDRINRKPLSDQEEREFMRIQRIYYGILADIRESKKPPKLIRGLGTLSHLVGGPLILNVPNVIDPKNKLGSRWANKEAARLYRKDGTGPVSQNELAGLNHLEVSRLQPPPNHVGLNPALPGNHYSQFLKDMTNLIRSVDKKNSAFDFDYAKRVVFYPNEIKTFSELSNKMENSKFNFHINRYQLQQSMKVNSDGKALESGKIDRQMAERESIDKAYIGANYVLFKECQLSLFNPAIKRLGGASLSNVGAPDDRLARSSLVFNAWIKNKDMKDDNSRVGLLYNLSTGAFDRHVEFQSDLGCTLGSLRSSGQLNNFKKSFIVYYPTTINFFLRPLYIPKAWKECTWADARWMALRIAALSRTDLERCFSESGWPSFAQKVAVERLLSRRNELVKAFKLDWDGVREIPCDPDFTMEVSTKTGRHTPVKNGNINGDSQMVKDLEESIHPEGLAKVISRKND
ncbi:hypothetical protein HYY75_02250 [bacterium]|nr:hypothetical protein [bacterium]